MPNNNERYVDHQVIPSLEMVEKLDDYGHKKATTNFLSLILLGILAGAFIGLGGIFYTSTITGILPQGGFGIKQLFGGLAFSLGLILVIISGAELFTGNTLIISGFLSKRVTAKQLLYNWSVVYIGNFVGSIITAWIIFMCNQHLTGDPSTDSFVGISAMKVASAKCGNDFLTAMFKGIMCNALVCLAVWMCLSAKTITDKILAIVPPITAFVALGFEHSVANMFIIPFGLMIKKLSAASGAELPEVFNATADKLDNLTIENMITANLIPVTIGNIIGGVLFVGIIYWVIYKKKKTI